MTKKEKKEKKIEKIKKLIDNGKTTEALEMVANDIEVLFDLGLFFYKQENSQLLK